MNTRSSMYSSRTQDDGGHDVNSSGSPTEHEHEVVIPPLPNLGSLKEPEHDVFRASSSIGIKPLRHNQTICTAASWIRAKKDCPICRGA
jgi:hypothetical protein